MFSPWKCLGRSERRSLVKLVKLARDSATFLFRRKSPSWSQSKLVRCTGCERQKAGGGSCRDHTKTIASFLDAIDPPAVRNCVECKGPLAAWVKGARCATCNDTDALLRQQMLQLHAALGSGNAQWITATQVAMFGGGGGGGGRASTSALGSGSWVSPGFVSVFGGALSSGEYVFSREKAYAMEPKMVIGPILAYRSWRVRGGKLGSLNGGLNDNESPDVPRWQLKEPMTGNVREHGVYAHRLPKQIERDPKYVSGGVWLWGDVIEHENGFRASFGYPAFLWLVDPKLDWSKPKTWQSGSRMKQLAKKYGVPLFAVDSLENLPEREGLRERLLLS
jgi:hypothetical protein